MFKAHIDQAMYLITRLCLIGVFPKLRDMISVKRFDAREWKTSRGWENLTFLFEDQLTGYIKHYVRKSALKAVLL